jgi:ribosome-binding factor A
MTERMRRVNESVRVVVAEAVGGLGDPRLGIVTVTGVKVSPDLHDARVYVSVFGSKKRRTAAMAALEAARGVVQGHVAKELRMKRTPQLTFEYDPSVEHGVHMTKLIDALAPDPPSDDAPGAADAD